jgi:glycosyltransferase involved in cell wall biosynthesis
MAREEAVKAGPRTVPGLQGDAQGDPLEEAVLRATRVLVAIPAFNEAPTIGSIVLQARKYADEVVVVDDGSTDDTAWVAEQAGAQIIHHESNLGYGAALRSCFERARENSEDVMVILDGDGQHDPSAIPRVLDPVVRGRADVSVGSRFLNGKNGNGVPPYRRLGIGFLTRLTNLGTRKGVELRDAQSGFRAYSRKAIELIDPREADMGASTEIIWDADQNNLRIVEVPINVTYNRNGSTKGPVRHGMSVMGSMLVYIETKHALLTFGIPGLLLLATGLGLGFTVVQNYQATHELAVGLALVTLMLVLVGALLMFSGLILHAVINANRRMH